MNEHEPQPARCHIAFKRSSSPNGQVGFDIDIWEGCTALEADRVMRLAKRLKEEADQVVGVGRALERSIERAARQ